MHMADPAGTEALIGGLPALGGGTQPPQNPAKPAEIVSLNAEQSAVARMLGLSQDDYLKTLKAEAQKEKN